MIKSWIENTRNEKVLIPDGEQCVQNTSEFRILQRQFLDTTYVVASVTTMGLLLYAIHRMVMKQNKRSALDKNGLNRVSKVMENSDYVRHAGCSLDKNQRCCC